MTYEYDAAGRRTKRTLENSTFTVYDYDSADQLTNLVRKVISGGATNATLLLTNVPVARAGRYWVVVSNVAGAVSSQEAGLTVTSAVNLRINSATVLISGFFSLSLTGPMGQVVGLEASGDLANWGVLTNLTIFKDPQEFVDTESATVQQRFYRLVMP